MIRHISHQKDFIGTITALALILVPLLTQKDEIVALREEHISWQELSLEDLSAHAVKHTAFKWQTRG